MKKIALIEGASPLGQHLALKLTQQGSSVLCVDDLTLHPSPATGTLLKRGVLEIGPLELAFKKEQIQQIYFLPRSPLVDSQIARTEFQVNSLLGILKVAEKIRLEKLTVVTTAALTEEALLHYQNILSGVKLKSATVLELISEMNLRS